MNNIKIKYLPLLLLCLFAIQTMHASDGVKYKMWYQQPADEWMKSLPLGNGRIGVNVFGGVDVETIALNEITMWSGQPDVFQERPLGKELLGEIRQLFYDKKYAEANNMVTKFMAGTPHSFGSHVPTGDLKLNFENKSKNIKNYKRELDLNSAIQTVTYEQDGVKYTREYYASNPDDVLVIKLTASKKASLNFSLEMNMHREAEIVATKAGLEFSGKVSFPNQGPGGVNFKGGVAVDLKGGKSEVSGSKLNIVNATEVVIAVDIRTDYSNTEYKTDVDKTLAKVLTKGYPNLRKDHIADYSNLYNRVAMFLGTTSTEDLPTDKRWERVKNGETDANMDALFFQYARYLLIAASRENSPLPANLQGIWNDNLACNMGWANDYHLDINTQQNYWLSNVGNLHETNAPLFNYIEDLAHHGQRSAKQVYSARGWVANTVANVWGYTASGAGVNWGLFPLASSWISTHLWTHYTYTLDKDYLKNKAYPLLKSNAMFLLDYLEEDPNSGYLLTGPATSPENSFRYKDDELSISLMPTSDRQLAYEILKSTSQASEILGVDAQFRDSLKQAIAKLPPIMIGKNKGIQEWFEDFEEAQPNHRHTTHLLGLYPFSQINVYDTPELAAAARKTIELRLAAENWEDVEWSRANMISFYARLLDGEKAYESVVQLQKEFARENLLTISPEGIAGAPYDIFIFDGNEAGGAGIAEMLIQSYNGYISLLPALPKAWSTGYFKGLCVVGGAEVNLEWKDMKALKAEIKATSDYNYKLRLGGDQQIASASINGKKIEIEINDNIVNLNLRKGDQLVLKF